MDLETVKFFHEKGQAVSKIIDVAPKSITPEQIQVAAERIYYRIKAGEQIEDCNLDWTVLAEAKEVKAEEFLQEQEILDDVNNVIKRIRKQKDDQITTLRQTIYEIDGYYQDHLKSINTQMIKLNEAVSGLKERSDLNDIWLHILEDISQATG